MTTQSKSIVDYLIGPALIVAGIIVFDGAKYAATAGNAEFITYRIMSLVACCIGLYFIVRRWNAYVLLALSALALATAGTIILAYAQTPGYSNPWVDLCFILIIGSLVGLFASWRAWPRQTAVIQN